MSFFRRIFARGQLSADEVRRAGHQLDRSRPALQSGGSVRVVQSGGGMSLLDGRADAFVAKITAVVTSPSLPTQYGFKEQWGPDPADGKYKDRVSGRVSDGSKNYALAGSGLSPSVGGYATIRRNALDPNYYEIVSLVADGFWAEITGSGGTPTAYSWKQKVLDGSFAWVDASPAVTGTTNAYPVAGSESAIAPAVGDPVWMRPSATESGQYEFQAVGTGRVWVKITGGSDAAGYSGTRQAQTAPGTWVDYPVGSPQSFGTGVIRRVPDSGNPAGPKALQAGDVVEVVPSLTVAGGYETQGVTRVREKVKGVLDGALAFGGSATLSVYANGMDTLENITVYDWLLSSGQTVAAGKQVTAFYDRDSARYFVDGAQCS